MPIVAHDLFWTTLNATFDVNGRVTTSGHVWSALLAAPHNEQFSGDNRDNGSNVGPKAIRRNNNNPLTWAAHKLDAPVPYQTVKLWGRRQRVDNTLASRPVMGGGFADASGNGYFGGWDNTSTTQYTPRIWRIDAANPGAWAILASGAAITEAAPWATLWETRINRVTGLIEFYHSGALRASVVDATYPGTIYPAVAAWVDAAGNTPLDYLLEILAEGEGETAQDLTLMWKPLGVNQWFYEGALDFALASTYNVELETTIDGSTRVRARRVALATYSATSSVTVTIDGAQVVIPAGRELVLDAPARQAMTIAGTAGSVRLRLYTDPAYGLYQRD